MKNLVRLVLITVLGFTLITASVRVLARTNSASPNPLFSNAERLIGQPVSAIEGYGFWCSEKQSYPSIFDTPKELRCVLEPTSGTFSEIGLVASEGIILEVDFKVRRGSLRVGNLMSSWGTPDAQKYNTTLYFYLHGRSVLAVVSHERKYFTPLMAVWRVYFLRCKNTSLGCHETVVS